MGVVISTDPRYSTPGGLSRIRRRLAAVPIYDIVLKLDLDIDEPEQLRSPTKAVSPHEHRPDTTLVAFEGMDGLMFGMSLLFWSAAGCFLFKRYVVPTKKSDV